ncbi:hypothetical protein O6H91_02G142700 [Diphasiastrum complanatum]|uniref:Uncharacterized protein n=1 Tax=Diphasiastrum complanatum TaxID=34168 RepID=A0ACC2ELF3_DIPCM|nr:hypothetical protein O6H91_02G142700 [Diphasiastrum complanatum]
MNSSSCFVKRFEIHTNSDLTISLNCWDNGRTPFGIKNWKNQTCFLHLPNLFGNWHHQMISQLPLSLSDRHNTIFQRDIMQYQRRQNSFEILIGPSKDSSSGT